MAELHQQRMNQMIKSAEGTAGLLHKFTKPTAWRGAQIFNRRRGCQVVGPLCSKEERMGKALTVGRKRAERGGWKNGGLKTLEEALPRLKECELEKCRDCTRQKQESDVTALPP